MGWWEWEEGRKEDRMGAACGGVWRPWDFSSDVGVNRGETDRSIDRPFRPSFPLFLFIAICVTAHITCNCATGLQAWSTQGLAEVRKFVWGLSALFPDRQPKRVIARVRNLCDVFREFCVYKVIPSHLCKPKKSAIYVPNSPNMSQTARSLVIAEMQTSRLGNGDVNVSEFDIEERTCQKPCGPIWLFLPTLWSTF